MPGFDGLFNESQAPLDALALILLVNGELFKHVDAMGWGKGAAEMDRGNPYAARHAARGLIDKGVYQAPAGLNEAGFRFFSMLLAHQAKHYYGVAD